MTSRKSAKPKSRLFPKVVIVLVLAVVVAGVRYVMGFLAGPPNYAGPGFGSVSVTVHSGDSLSVVGNTLKGANVVASVDAFVEAATVNPDSQSLQPGTYLLKHEMTAQDALNLLLSRKTRQSNAVVITEGLQAREIVNLFAQQTHLSKQELAATLKQVDKLGLPAFAKGKVEGYLFPASYEVGERQTALEVLRTMIKTFKSKVNPLSLETNARKIGLTPQQVMIIASLVQAESHPRDYSKVARVVLNRLKSDMPLQFDSTVNYGLGKSHVILTTAQLQTDTPFNTYLRTGLPPTPINNPGLEAIKAVLHPADGNWIYFVTVNLKTQETKFSESYSEFLKNKNEFLTWCNQNPGECSR